MIVMASPHIANVTISSPNKEIQKVKCRGLWILVGLRPISVESLISGMSLIESVIGLFGSPNIRVVMGLLGSPSTSVVTGLAGSPSTSVVIGLAGSPNKSVVTGLSA